MPGDAALRRAQKRQERAISPIKVAVEQPSSSWAARPRPWANGIGVAFALGAAALPLALTVDRITNGLTRPFFGWVSDRIGRENTMGIAFLLEAAAILAMLYFRDNALAFV